MVNEIKTCFFFDATLNLLEQHLEKIRYFRIAVEAGSLSKAAAKLRISQPAVSQAIQQLEFVLSLKLVVRSSQGISLTDSGKALYRYAIDLHRSAIQAEEILKNTAPALHLNVGTHQILIETFWPKFLSELQLIDPHTQVTLHGGRLPQLISQLHARQLDLLVMVEPTMHGQKLISHVLYEGTLNLFAATQLADRMNRSPHKVSLIQEQNLFTDLGAHLDESRPLAGLVGAWGFGRSVELYDFRDAVEYALKGDGIVLLPNQNARPWLASGLLKRIEKFEPMQFSNDYKMCLVHRDENPALKVTSFINYLKNSSTSF